MEHFPELDKNESRNSKPRKTGLLLAVLFLTVIFVAAQQVGSAAAQVECGVLAYEWNKPVTVSDHGFPIQQPPVNNFDWTQPIDYAHGILYYRVEINRQPEPQNMRLQLCFWQPVTPNASYKFGLENCGPQKAVAGQPGTVATWSVGVQDMWKLNGDYIDWTRPRFRAGVAIKNSAGDPVSDYSGWDWNGEDPDKWYPLDMHFTAVVVPNNGQFCGWSYYLDPTAVSLQQFRGHHESFFIALLFFIILTFISIWVWKLRPKID